MVRVENHGLREIERKFHIPVTLSLLEILHPSSPGIAGALGSTPLISNCLGRASPDLLPFAKDGLSITALGSDNPRL